MSNDEEVEDAVGRSLRAGRVAVLLAVFVLWGGLVCGRLAQFMVFQRDHFVALMHSEAWTVGEVPAIRGRLLGRNGVPLAWSTRHFRATYQVPEDLAGAAAELQQLGQRFPEFEIFTDDAPLVPGETRELVCDPAPDQLPALLALEREFKRLKVETFTRRHYHPHPALRRRLGKVRRIDGRVYGITGEEKRHDHLLRGTPGKYRVMTRRDGTWIPGTWETLRDLRRGYDVYLNLRVSSGT